MPRGKSYCPHSPRAIGPAEDVLEIWLGPQDRQVEAAVKATLRPSTYDSYAQHVACHIAPHVGAVKQQKLFGAQVNADSGLTFTAESDFGRRLSLPAADAVPTRT